jgi:hypothetical protein
MGRLVGSARHWQTYQRVQVIKRLAKHEPDAMDLLDKLYPADPNDDIPEDDKQGDDE